MQTPMGACTKPAAVPLRPVWCVFEDHQMTEDENKTTPADGQLVWVVVAFIVLMLGLLTLRSCL